MVGDEQEDEEQERQADGQQPSVLAMPDQEVVECVDRHCDRIQPEQQQSICMSVDKIQNLYFNILIQ